MNTFVGGYVVGMAVCAALLLAIMIINGQLPRLVCAVRGHNWAGRIKRARLISATPDGGLHYQPTEMDRQCLRCKRVETDK